MRSLLGKTIILTALAVLLSLLVACDEDNASKKKEMDVQKDNYERLTGMEPAKEVTNPKTRETINFFTETWNEKEQLAYVYLQNSEGKMIGYYVLDGPPVSMCTSITPNYDTKYSSNNGYTVIPAPGIDGVYRSAEDCSRYYGKDATNGAYVEFTVGMGINMLLYTEPLTNHPNVENLAPQGK